MFRIATKSACFKWAVLSALFPPKSKRFEHVSNYKPFINHIVEEMITPVSVKIIYCYGEYQKLFSDYPQ